MIGWINLSVEAFICDSFGRDAWVQIVKQAHVDCNWVSSCPYPDKITYDLVITGAGILGVTVPQALEAYGQYFVNYVIKQGYTRLLRSLGSNIAEFLANLNNLHLHLTMGFPSMVAPAFRVEQVTSTSLLLHYHSIRPALWPIVSGVLKGASKFLFQHEVEMELVASREAGDCDHEVFRVTYPHQESLSSWDDHGAALASSYSMTNEFFYEMFPFHIILDRECRVLQCGRVMARLFGKTLTRGSAVADTFKLRHPYIPFEYDKMVLESSSLYLLKSLETGLEFKGQMVQTSMPDGLSVLLFLGSPRVANLEEMSVHGIYLSDIPLHDMSRDFVLLAEQRQAEADLKERFEKMAVDLRVTNERLEQATRWLDEERQRSDALLYRMLPADIAADLREGRKVEAISYPEVTILFSDMVGFTTTSAKSTPEEVYNMLNEMYDKFDTLVDDFPDVYKLETIGDAYFLVCNLTTHCENHVDVVIDFAIRMQALARQVKNAQGEPVQIRIGIHTGPVVGGVLGAKTPRFSIYGDTVNVASRMESHGLPGKIHISDVSYKCIVEKEKYAVRERGNIAVKGRGNMTTYLIGGTNDDWLLRHTSFDLQVDGGSGQLRDGSFVVTASQRSAESLAPSRLPGMEAIKEGDEDRSSRPNADAAAVTTITTTSGGSTGANREGSGRHTITAAAAAAAAAAAGSRGSTPGLAHSSSSGQVSQQLVVARGSGENAAPASNGGIDAFISPQAAAAAAAAAGAAAMAMPSREGPPALVRDGSLSLREASVPGAAPPPPGLHRDTSFRAVYARGSRALNPSSPTVSSRSGLAAGTSYNNMVAAVTAGTAGSGGGGSGAGASNSDLEQSQHQIPSSSSYNHMTDALLAGNANLSHPRSSVTSSGVGPSPAAYHPYEPSPLSRPEPSGGSNMSFTAPSGIVLARSATSKASPLVTAASTGGAATMTMGAVPPAAAVLPSASSAPAAGGGSRAHVAALQQLKENDQEPRVSSAGSGLHASLGSEMYASLAGEGASPTSASKPTSLARKLKNLFKK